jgi:hypothetical protein
MRHTACHNFCRSAVLILTSIEINTQTIGTFLLHNPIIGGPLQFLDRLPLVVKREQLN